MPSDLILRLLVEYRYWIVIPLAFLEGPIVSLSVGFLASLGYFNPIFMFAVLLVRDLSMDSGYYAIGRYGRHAKFVEKYGRKIGLTDTQWSFAENLWKRSPRKTMFVGKLSYGIAPPFIVSAGASGVSYAKFCYYSMQVSILQYGTLMLAGYYYGNSSYDLISRSFRDAGLVLAGIVVLGVAIHLVNRAMRTKVMDKKGDL